MDYRQAVDYLERHTNLEGTKRGTGGPTLPTAGRTEGLSLEPIGELLSAVGDPHRAYRVIHITGTNGKGSTSRLISAILAATGLSVGTFTSPNLERINERISWDGEPIPDDAFAQVMTLLADVEPLLEHRPGRFDLLAAAAFVWFAELGVDVAVIEVGLLGRFDSTNVVDSDVAVITNVGKDHTDGAPGWELEVATEKAGIIKPDSVVVLGEPFGHLRAAIDAETERVGAVRAVWEAGTDFGVETNTLAVGGRAIDVRTPGASFEQLFLPVHGEHQGDNLATALAAVEAFFGRPLDQAVVEDAIAEIELPGRFEVIGRDPTVVLDGAHNVQGATAAKRTLDSEFARLGSRVLVVGMLDGKDPVELLEALGATDFDAVIATQPTWSRAVPAESLAEAAATIGVAAEVVADPVEAFRRAKAVATGEDLILVAGSIYLVGEIRPTARSVAED